MFDKKIERALHLLICSALSCGGRSTDTARDGQPPLSAAPRDDATMTAPSSLPPTAAVPATATTSTEPLAPSNSAAAAGGNSAAAMQPPSVECGGLEQVCCEAAQECDEFGCLEILNLPCNNDLQCCGTLLCLPDCDAHSAGTAGVSRYRGQWISTFERSAFIECGGAFLGWWWMPNDATPGMDLVEQVVASGNAYARLYVELDGTLSEPGEYGHLGQYPHELTDTTIRYVRYASDQDCQ